jgi:hypothetical protein
MEDCPHPTKERLLGCVNGPLNSCRQDPSNQANLACRPAIPLSRSDMEWIEGN